MTTAPVSFYLLGIADDIKMKLKITEASLIVTQVEFSP
jgi:hypothetical protein